MRINMSQDLVVKQVQKKTLDHVFCVFRTLSAAPDKRIQRKPIKSAQLGKRIL